MSADASRRRHRETLPLVALSVAALIAITLTVARALAPALVDLEHFAADSRTAWLADRRVGQHPEIAVVFIDEVALARFAGHNYRSPTDRGVLARVAAIVDRAAPRVIGFDYIFDRPTDPAKDKALLEAVRTARSRVVLGVADERATMTPEQREFQAEVVSVAGRETGHLSLTYDRDDVVRYLSRPARSGAVPASFAERLAEGVPPPPDRADRPPVLPIARGDHRNHRIAWLTVEGLDPQDTFRSVPALALLEAEQQGGPLAQTLAGLLKDRIVIIGGDFADMDRHDTPLKVLGAEKLRGAVLHAHMVAQLIDRRAVTHAPAFVEPIVLFILALAGFVVGVTWNLERFVYMIGVTALIEIDILVFLSLRTIMPFTLPLLAWLAGAWIGRNLDLLGGYVRRRRRAGPVGGG